MKRTSAAQACCKRYGGGRDFLALFNPEQQRRYCAEANLDKCYSGTAPTLRTVTEAYGDGIANAWLGIQLRDLANFSGCREKLTEEQYDFLAESIKAAYGHFKVTELMHFFLQMKLGKYGYFFGAVDGMVITTALQKFAEQRAEIKARLLKEAEELRKREDAERSRLAAAAFKAAREVCHMSVTEYLAADELHSLSLPELSEVGWLFRQGYETEQAREQLRQCRHLHANIR